MNKVLNYFKELTKEKPFIKNIRVYGWQKEYDYQLVSSITDYLFEDFEVIENIAPLSNENRPGNKKKKYYITVHDTGDSDSIHTAKFWSDTVKNEYWEQGKYSCSFQYVVGNDGIYHNIPDDEVAWHAGDSTEFDYNLYDSNVKGSNLTPIITISNDGYYEIDQVKSTIKAPRIYKVKDNKVLLDRMPKTCDINDQGILCKLIDDKYYIGETYFAQGYEKICNRGGNNNSIGIESCINEGTDIFLTFQRVAKLVAHLMKQNNFNIDDIKQHHYYSGKNCPQTLRMNGLWDYFLNLVKVEKQVLDYLDEGYEITLIPCEESILKNGRITLPNEAKKVSYKIQTIYNGVKEEETFVITLPKKEE